MRSKVTVVLLFLNVVLFAYIWFYDLPHIREAQTLESRRRVLGPEAATIEALTRTNRAGETVKLEKRTDSWWLTVPYEWPADRNAIAGLLSTLELLEHETSFPVAELAASGRSLADYGLADPALTLGFTSAGRNYTLKIGDTTEVGNRLYVLSADGTRIHVVSRSLAEAISLPLDTLRAASLFTVPVFEVRSLNVQTAAPANLKVRLRRDAAAHWAFEAPINARASKAAVEVTINSVNALTARTFLEPRDTDLDRAGLNSPALRVTLEGNARRETLLLGNPTGAVIPPREGTTVPDTEYFAKIEDKTVVFTTVVPKPLLDVLRAAQEELRDPRVLDFEPATVTAFTIVAPGQPELALQKLEGEQGWQAIVRVPGSTPSAIAADPGVVTELLQKISLLSAREARPGAPKFLSDAPAASDLENWGFNRPEREITLNLSTGGGPLGKEASTLTLQVGVSPDKPGEAFARVTNAPFVYQILPDILDDAPALARHFRRRILRELPEAARITELKLTALPAGTEVFTARNETALTAESLASAKLSDKARTVLATLLGQLRTLRAKAFTAGTFTADHAETPRGPQPWKYQLDATLVLPGGNGAAPTPTVSTLYFTDRLGGTTMLVGTPEFDGVVFEATQEMLDAVFALTYVEKQDPGPPAPASVPTTAPPPTKL
ncbi:DUF4340 domain-containing protein [Opitutus sp. GAS368]|uniref:DUF4340 domain-containing protein n=1 Tax=Opitutus sp. GAS368 TaxID=1882749 RepID=UPI00087A6E2B|nr:DUF4340 domain-containing protein [Opitutus sp. GAS368]SDR72136.1 protein of unknown function [Opitutus sp. GAS368]